MDQLESAICKDSLRASGAEGGFRTRWQGASQLDVMPTLGLSPASLRGKVRDVALFEIGDLGFDDHRIFRRHGRMSSHAAQETPRAPSRSPHCATIRCRSMRANSA